MHRTSKRVLFAILGHSALHIFPILRPLSPIADYRKHEDRSKEQTAFGSLSEWNVFVQPLK